MVVLAQLYVAALLNAKDHLMRSDGDGGNHSSNLTIYVITVNALITLTALCVYIVYEAFEIFVHLFTLLITIVVVVAGMVVRQGHREVGRGKMSKVVIEGETLTFCFPHPSFICFHVHTHRLTPPPSPQLPPPYTCQSS